MIFCNFLVRCLKICGFFWCNCVLICINVVLYKRCLKIFFLYVILFVLIILIFGFKCCVNVWILVNVVGLIYLLFSLLKFFFGLMIIFFLLLLIYKLLLMLLILFMYIKGNLFKILVIVLKCVILKNGGNFIFNGLVKNWKIFVKSFFVNLKL